MNKIVNISNDKKSSLEFDIEVTGAVEDDMAVRFIIESEGMMLGFDSKKEKGDTWSVEIPAMRILDKTVYPFYISVVVDGYTFEGLRGSVNVIGDRKVHISDPVLVPAKAKKRVVKKATPKEETKATVIKPNKKSIGKPATLKVTDSAVLLKALNAKKSTTKKKEEPLDSKTLDVIDKAKEEKTKKLEAKKKLDAKKKAEAIKKEQATKKEKAKQEKEVKEEKVETIIPPTVINERKPLNGFSAKNAAKDLIKAVTGLGVSQNEPVINEDQNKKVKDILKEDIPAAKVARTKASHKKVIRGKDIVEVDGAKEDQIKKILDESDDKRSVTTKPINKKLH